MHVCQLMLRESEGRNGWGRPGAGIAGSHRIAMRLDDRYQLVAGVFSRNRDQSLAAARELGISEDRVYPDYETMATREAEREDGVDAVAIVTPDRQSL